VAVALQESILNGFTDLVGLGLPGTETNSGNLVPGVQGISLPTGTSDWLVDILLLAL
jgi:hypothetical protein